MKKEALARIKINKLLEAAGWRFFPDGRRPANIQLEVGTTIKPDQLDGLGDDFEKTGKGYIDFLLLNEKGYPFIVLEAKSEQRDPLEAKEQARKYARSLNCRFVILSNGNLHYFWDLDRGNPYVLTSFPRPDSVRHYEKVAPDPARLINEPVGADYIALTQRPTYAEDAGWKNPAERAAYVEANKLRFLRGYQQRAVHAIQRAVRDGRDRFLFEMATGTGKTLVSAAVIKLFLRTANASRVLFLVDRLELENQAANHFAKDPALLKNDFTTVVYKESRDDWRKANIVVSTVQSLQFNNKYQQLFSPTDFDLVISDEAHRSIGGNARAVFDYFIGYKLGLTATPRGFLKHYDETNKTTRDPREYERRVLLDTYRTFGCESGEPTFRYSLIDGVTDPEGPFLVNPITVDARTEVTTKLLSDQGFVVSVTDEEGNDREKTYEDTHFEKKFFSGATNATFCRAFMENALRDPVSGEIGKSIVFAVSQRHAGKIAHILNQKADRMFPGKYQSDFAVQVTSKITGAQQMTVNFANNNLLGSANFLPDYRTSKARVCVTVGMMTTGYDCEDLLNVVLMRPIFSPTDFVQMKGRGTRLHDFRKELFNDQLKTDVAEPKKNHFKLFDFFANCEYFEEEYDYDQVLELPKPGAESEGDDPPPDRDDPLTISGAYEHLGADIIASIREEPVGPQGMKVDRMLFEKFGQTVKADDKIAAAVEHGKWDEVIEYVNHEVFDKPEEYYTLDKLRRSVGVDRRLTLKEILQHVFGLIPRLKSRNELLEEEFAKFVADVKPGEAEAIPAIKNYFKAYATSDLVRSIIENRDYAALHTNPGFSFADFRAVPEKYRSLIPEYVKDYVSLNQFVA